MKILIMQLINIMFITKDISKIRKILIKDISVSIIRLIIYISKDIRNISKNIRIYNWP